MAGKWSTSKPLRRGIAMLVLCVGGFLTWSLATEIEGAVVASGEVSVEARRQVIQHPDGGLVTKLHVRDGSHVQAGDPILTLDGTELHAQKVVTGLSYVELLARIDRLVAEIQGADEIAFRAELLDFDIEAADAESIMVEETALFEARHTKLHQTLALLDKRKIQTNAIIAGRTQQLEAERKQQKLVLEDTEVQVQLVDRGVVANNQLRILQRESAHLEGTIGELEASIAEAEGRITEIEEERLRLRAEFLETAQKELRDLIPRRAELRERLHVINTRISRLVLRVPMAGTVLGLQAHTIGGVVLPGAEVASIIPADVPLILLVEINPSQIDRVYAGQDAMIRFPNFNANTTPEVEGQVTTISADAVTDSATGRRFFLAEIAFAHGALDALGEVTLQPGMPVEAFIRTESRTPASFIMKPIRDYWVHVMREE